MRVIEVIELRGEDRVIVGLADLADLAKVAAIVGRYGLKVEAMNNEISPLLQPLVPIIPWRTLEGPEPLPLAALRELGIHLRHVVVDTIHDRLEPLVLEAPKVEEGEVQQCPSRMRTGPFGSDGRVRRQRV